MAEADKKDDHTPGPLEQAMAVFGDELQQEAAAAAGRRIRADLIRDERARRELDRQRNFAEQQRRDELGVGTPPSEALDEWNTELCADFLKLLDKVRDERGVDGFAYATTLPPAREGIKPARGFLIGCAGEQPQDSGSVGHATGLYLCEDGLLRTYRTDRPSQGSRMAVQGVPLNHEGEHVGIFPGHFAEKTVPRRQFISTKIGKIPPLPAGVEGAGSLYKSGVAYYQTYQVHPFVPESLETALAATAHYVIEEGKARPAYDRFGPTPAS